MTKHPIAGSAPHDRRGWWGRISVIIVFLSLLVLCIKTSLAEEAAIVFAVNSTLDERDAVPGDRACFSTPSGLCTLRAAVEEGQASNFAISVPAGMYGLNPALGQLKVTRNLTLSGAGSGKTRLDGAGQRRVFDIELAGFAYIDGVTIQWGVGEPGFLNHWHGGGIHNHGTLILVNSTVRTSASGPGWGGGGISNAAGATATLVNVTITSNSTMAQGGGIENTGTLDLYNVTIASNQVFGGASTGGGIFNGAAGTVHLRNTLIANNVSGGNCSGALNDQGWNLSSDSTCNFTAIGSRNNGDPRLGERDENDAYPLLAGSQALDAGNPAPPAGGNTCTAQDQRRVSRPQDGDGNGSAICDIGAYEVLAPVTDLIFRDGFESGNLSAWTSRVTDGDDLKVNTAARLIGNYGMRARIDDNAPIYVTDNTPDSEKRYRARFYFDPNSISMVSGNTHQIFQGYMNSTSSVVTRVEFRFANGSYRLRAGVRDDAAIWRNSSWFAISDAPHRVEFAWQASTAPGANNGRLVFWIDGVRKATISSVDNDTRRVGLAILGAVTGIDSGTRGVYYLDAFESRRLSFIGLASSDATDAVEAVALPEEMPTHEEEMAALDTLGTLAFALDPLEIELAPSTDDTSEAAALVITPTLQAVPPRDYLLLGPLFELQAFVADGSLATTLAQPATLVIDYSEAVYDAGLPATALFLQTWNKDTGLWEMLPTTVDVENHTLIAVVHQPTTFALTYQGDAPFSQLFLPFIQR